MKLLIFTDLHGSSKAFDKLVSKIKKGRPDAIICAGDLTIFGSGLKTLMKRFDAFGIPMFVIPGNHETEEELEIYSRDLKFIQSIHLRAVLFDSVLFIGCGGGGFTEQHAAFEQSEKDFASSIKKIKIKNQRHKVVLVVHQPPSNTRLDELYGYHVGSTSIRNFIETHHVDLCITGHIHEDEGKSDKIGKTKVINPGPEGQIIEI